jgi:hypothetical protein
LESQWKNAVKRFVLNNLGQFDQEDLDTWLEGERDLTPLLEPVLKTMGGHRDVILAEMHQLSPSEILDRFVVEHPELSIPDKQKALVRVGRELELMKAVLQRT